MKLIGLKEEEMDLIEHGGIGWRASRASLLHDLWRRGTTVREKRREEWKITS
jgi:hypothetical protein